MTLRTANFCIDAHDPKAQAEWWARVVDDFVLDEEDSDEDEVALIGPAGRVMIFLRVPEDKTVKNRMHMCLRPVDRSRDEEVTRLLQMGASMFDDRRTADAGWAVLSDPEGNEFCVLTTPADAAGIRHH
ncbi:VOC family protein [Kineosporia babensis]|uniref:VOC family protein n=1 Tax=Kineosporia babensis TaxID=499548 RepID=A0A9X1NCS8_9ACTN|nr:VOC family protein [Kineosporia babensis]MCD5310668.1 VOC family protein [Kineosporia babensis]